MKIGFDVQGIFAISEVDMDYQMTVYFRQTWKGKIGISRFHLRSWRLDPRLALGLNCSLNVRRQRLEKFELSLQGVLFEGYKIPWNTGHLQLLYPKILN